jgi:hypothetical protein
MIATLVVEALVFTAFAGDKVTTTPLKYNAEDVLNLKVLRERLSSFVEL